MVIESLLYIILLAGLIIGSYTDWKTREVPDFINYGLIFAGIGLRVLYSAATYDWRIAIEGLLGFGIFFAIAYVMFYGGQWGGGDSKMIIGIGALLGLSFSEKIPFLVHLVFNIAIIGSVYGILWSIYLAVRHKKIFLKEFRKVRSIDKIKRLSWLFLGMSILLLIPLFLVHFLFLKLIILLIIFAPLMTLYLWVFAKSIENACMLKYILPEDLTEGDWIAKDIKIKGEYIAGPKDLGIEKVQIKRLVELHKQGKVRKVLIKEGIPFVPSFLMAFISTYLFGSFLSLLF